MKGQIIDLKEVFDDVECRTKYQAVIWFDNIPDLKLGGAELTNVRVTKSMNKKLREMMHR